MRDIVVSWGPDQEDDPPEPHGQALEPEFAVGFSVVFHSDHVAIVKSYAPLRLRAERLLTHSSSASFMRVCQPEPVDLKYCSTSGL